MENAVTVAVFSVILLLLYAAVRYLIKRSKQSDYGVDMCSGCKGCGSSLTLCTGKKMLEAKRREALERERAERARL